MEQFDIVTTFSEDIGMKSGEDKCAYLQIKTGKTVQHEEPIFSNLLNRYLVIFKLIKGSECYLYRQSFTKFLRLTLAFM